MAKVASESPAFAMLSNESAANTTTTATEAEQLLQLIKQLIAEEQYEGVQLLFVSATEAAHNLQLLQQLANDLLQDVVRAHLTPDNFNVNMALYDCAEQLLNVLATHAPTNELLLDLLEMLEEQKSEQVFTSTLRAMQTVLLRIGDANPRALDWVFNSLKSALTNVHWQQQQPNDVFDLDAMQLLEQREDVQLFLQHLITVGLFNEALLKSIQMDKTQNNIFRNCGYTRSNILCCFLIQLLDKPLALLDLTCDERQTNSYTLQCARNFCQDALTCIKEPFILFSLVEQRVRFKRRLNAAQGVYELSSQNIFLIEESLPLLGLSIFFYLLYAERIVPTWQVPQVLAPMFIFETGAYLTLLLLQQKTTPAMQYRGLLLMEKLLEKLPTTDISADYLQLDLYANLCSELANISGYNAQHVLRKLSVELLSVYINKFTHPGRYMLIVLLLNSSKHLGLKSFLFNLYKRNAATFFKSAREVYAGSNLRTFVLQHLCCLPEGVETDLVDNAAYISTALNTLRFFALFNPEQTGFYELFNEIEQNHMQQLRNAVDLSTAHYNEQLKRCRQGNFDEKHELQSAQMLENQILNDTESVPKKPMNMQERITMLEKNLLTINMLTFDLANLSDAMEQQRRKLSQQQKQLASAVDA